jgi:hypothetical protein
MDVARGTLLLVFYCWCFCSIRAWVTRGRWWARPSPLFGVTAGSSYLVAALIGPKSGWQALFDVAAGCVLVAVSWSRLGSTARG